MYATPRWRRSTQFAFRADTAVFILSFQDYVSQYSQSVAPEKVQESTVTARLPDTLRHFYIFLGSDVLEIDQQILLPILQHVLLGPNIASLNITAHDRAWTVSWTKTSHLLWNVQFALWTWSENPKCRLVVAHRPIHVSHSGLWPTSLCIILAREK